MSDTPCGADEKLRFDEELIVFALKQA